MTQITDRPKVKPTDFEDTISEKEAEQIDFTIDVCLMISQAFRIAEQCAENHDYEGYENTLREAIAAAGKTDAGGSVIAEAFIDKFSFASWQILTDDMDKDQLEKMLDNMNDKPKR